MIDVWEIGFYIGGIEQLLDGKGICFYNYGNKNHGCSFEIVDVFAEFDV